MSFSEKLQAIEAVNQLRQLSPPLQRRGAMLRIENSLLVNFASNDYLGLAEHPTIQDAATKAICKFGMGAGSARLVTGNLVPNQKLEAQLEAYFGRSALLFNSGYAANSGIIPAITDEDCVVFSDSHNHASIIDGCRLSRARVEIFAHNDLVELTKKLSQCEPGKQKWVITESVFSMGGDLAPLSSLDALAKKHSAKLYVDEAHAIGWAGGGPGLSEACGVTPEVVVGTFGKALGSYGAFCLGQAPLIKLLLNRARTFVFSTGLPPSVVAASSAALGLIEYDGKNLQARLSRNCRLLAQRLEELGIPSSADSPIFPIPTGTEERGMAIAADLQRSGFYCQAIRPPTVPLGTSRLRATIRADHEEGQIHAFCDALGRSLFHVEHFATP